MKAEIKNIIYFLALFVTIQGYVCAVGASEPSTRVKETFDTVDAVLHPDSRKPIDNNLHGDKKIQSGTTQIPVNRSLPNPEKETGENKHSVPDIREQAADVSQNVREQLLKGRYVALLIGINDYYHLDKLENATGDAISVAEELRNLYGFQTYLLLDREATREGIMRALNELRRSLREDDSLLVYYSGHGHYVRESDTAYWLPVDADPDDNTRWLETRSFIDQFKLIAARQVLVVADSCFAGSITRSTSLNLDSAVTRDVYLVKLMEKTTRVLIASGGNEPVVDAGCNSHSVFTCALLQALRAPFSPIFTAEELMARHLKESVTGRADQIPEYKVMRNSGHNGGDFIFIKRK